ncbi:MAG: hypothetical protein GWP56_16605 [Gammaproteobacteria bacterium]|jgi:hypothetical protein|nr:hypothetical protein [Gammaproteobacteria bacterium]
MAQFVPKAKLFEQLTQIIDQRETGLLTILTESNRSIFLRFSQGKLTRLHCRSGEAGEAIQMLAESAMVKYTYATAPQDSEPEFMPADSFLQLIDPGAAAGNSSNAKPIVSSGDMVAGDPVKAQMLEIATEYMGVVAEMIVDEAFENNSDVGKAIDYIGNAIPDANQSKAFRKDALAHFSSIKV